MNKESTFVLNAIAQAIYDKKGANIMAIDVRACSSITDYVIIAEGQADKHVISLSSSVEKTLAEIGLYPIQKQGDKVGDWIVLDYFEVMVHLFLPGVRQKYELEQLWQAGEIVDLKIDTSSLPSSRCSAPRSIASL